MLEAKQKDILFVLTQNAVRKYCHRTLNTYSASGQGCGRQEEGAVGGHSAWSFGSQAGGSKDESCPSTIYKPAVIAVAGGMATLLSFLSGM